MESAMMNLPMLLTGVEHESGTDKTLNGEKIGW